MKLWHTPTLEAYKELMAELKEKNYKWYDGNEPSLDYIKPFERKGSKLVIGVDEDTKYLFYADIAYYGKWYPNETIIEYKVENKLPDFAKKWLQWCKEHKKCLSFALDIETYFINVVLNDFAELENLRQTHEDVCRWLRKNRLENENLFAKAWINFKTYRVKLGNLYINQYNADMYGVSENDFRKFYDKQEADNVAKLVGGKVEEL